MNVKSLRAGLGNAGLLVLVLWPDAAAARDNVPGADKGPVTVEIESAVTGGGTDLPVSPEENAPAKDVETEDVIQVTGTHIPRPDAQAASPVLSFDRDELLKFRSSTLEDFLNTLPQVTPDFDRTSNNPGDGTASISLRGLGRTRTLVLLNGRRLAPTGTSTAIDINTVPAALLERVEIVTGGTSAVYGSDAVSGVVNFITRDDLEGIEISNQFDIYGAGDGEVYNISGAAGMFFADRRGHISVYGDYLDRRPVLQGARDFSSVTIGEDREAGELVESGSGITPNGVIGFPLALIDGQPAFPIFNPDGSVRAATLQDYYNYAPDNYLQTPLERWSTGAFIDFELSSGIDLFAELMYTRPESAGQLAPTPALFTGPLVIDSPFLADSTRELLRTAYDPDMDGIGQVLFARRFTEVGPRRVVIGRNYARAVAGFRASLSSSWSLDGHYSYSRNTSLARYENDVSLSRLRQGLLIDPLTGHCVDPSGGCVAVNIFGTGNLSTAAADFIRIDNFETRDRSAQHLASLIVSGDAFTWSQGTLRAAAGVEYRHNEAELEPSPLFTSGDTLGFASGTPAQGGNIDLYEAFGEILVPVLKDQPFADRIELEAGGRYSHYSTAGGVWTWKAGGQWLLLEGLRFRGVWQRAVRAPTVEELFTAPAVSQSLIAAHDDFCLASNDPVGRGLADVCVAQGMDLAQVGIYDVPPTVSLPVTLINTGNPNLVPEHANTITAGADYTIFGPVRLHVGADYFNVEIEDVIGVIGRSLPFCALDGNPDSAICRAVIRDASGFPVSARRQPFNLSILRVKGIDFSLETGIAAPSWLQIAPDADITLRSNATWYLEFGQAVSPEAPYFDCAGAFSGGCSSLTRSAGSTYPDLLVTTVLSYDTARFGASLRWHWIGPMDNLAPAFDAFSGLPPPNLPIPSVDSRNYLDVSFRFAVTNSMRLRAGVDNILETDPPLLGFEARQANTDPSRFNVFGRRFYLGMELRFGGD